LTFKKDDNRITKFRIVEGFISKLANITLHKTSASHLLLKTGYEGTLELRFAIGIQNRPLGYLDC
jgi:hypothetical protein